MGSKERMYNLLGTKTLFLLLVFLFSICSSVTASVWYDHKAVTINGQRRILISGSIHYPRSTPEMWPDLIKKAKDGGLDVIQTYVFWNGHEPSPGKYYFGGNYDLVRFIKLVKQAGLYVHLRIGPYVCAEWNFGGFPAWLKYVPGISFRTDNGPFKDAMQKFTTKIVDMMKAEGFFQTQGGPIIMSQIENEYGPVEYMTGPPGKAYTNWAAAMAVGLNTGVPWVMCKQDDTPDPLMNGCNGFYCDWYTPNKPNKPKLWTENWTGWYIGWGGPVPYRSVEDTAFSVALFIQKGGSFVNYYMYHGGTNFGRTSGAFVATSYDYDAPIDEYGLAREPKLGHLTNLHKAIKLCEQALVFSEPTKTSLGKNQEAHVFYYKGGGCAAFLANYDTQYYVTVDFKGMKYYLPPWSISILPDCKNTVYNTAQVGVQSMQMKMTPVSKWFTWESYYDGTVSYDDKAYTKIGLVDQLNITRDATDYLWYSTAVKIEPNEAFLKNGKYPWLTVVSAGHAVDVYINGKLAGSAYGNVDKPQLTFSGQVNLIAGMNQISLLSKAVGLPNTYPHFETWYTGIVGPVTLSGLNEGKRDLTWQKWSYKTGMNGEALNLYSLRGSSSVGWMKGSQVAKKQPLIWYKTFFNAPAGNDPLALDMGTMGKGQVWINGQSIGRHWAANKAYGQCGACHYMGTFNEKKCQSNCGQPSQRWYHVPRSWLKPTGNLMVVFEEWGGDPSGISLDSRTVDGVCAYIYDWQPSLTSYQSQTWGKGPIRPTANLWCPPGKKISSIKFASFGTPQGGCGGYSEGTCHAHKSYDPFQKNCIGKPACWVTVDPEVFGGDPCPNVYKQLAVEAICV